MKLKKYIIIFAIIALLIVAGASFLQPSSSSELNRKNKPRSPDWFMVTASGKTTNQAGQLKGSFKSPAMQHFEASNTISLSKPFFIMLDDNNIPWHISSLYGTTYQNKPQHIKLWDHVVVQQMPGTNSKQTTVYTSELFYYPDTHMATTDKPVIVKEQDSILHAVGMKANLKTGVIKFLSKTKAEYYDDQQNNNMFDIDGSQQPKSNTSSNSNSSKEHKATSNQAVSN